MKKILHKSVCSLLFALMLLTACTGNFEEINTSPNAYEPNKVDPKFVLSLVLTRSKLFVNDYQNIQLLVIDNYSQFYANDLGFAVYNSYNQVDQSISSLWSTHTYGWLNALNTIIRQYEDAPEHVNVIQMARIWKSWLVLRATDAWGDIPYFQACDGSGELPPYDRQQDIYDDLFKTLADAASKFDPTKNNPLTLDMVYDGNLDNWRRFANSLRLRMAMRISFVDPARAKTEAESAIAGGLISNATQKASVRCDNNGVNSQSPYFYTFSGGGYGMSLTMENILTGLGGQPWTSSDFVTEHPDIVDPRGPIMFNPCNLAAAGNPDFVGRWAGSRPGLISASGNQTTQSVARQGRYVWTDPTRRFNILKYSEICFLLAEAKLRFPSWSTGAGTAESWYVAGIMDNMAEWGVASAVVDAYLASNSPNVNGTTVPYSNVSGANNAELDKIITQKWLAMFPDCGWEAWADHRRLQKPKFIPYEGVNSLWFPGAYDNTQDVPQNYVRRMAYPVSEQTLNKANLQAALVPLGGTFEGYVRKPMWWDPYSESGAPK
ncbi:MAG: SusD/RagB family nutrient-binding outer membrane lipoprotein [Bacteroidales bacterium]|nr:SusD/RagB family nutrient-binding outer membrane lipoprotein [Bacteroidales bacterium]